MQVLHGQISDALGGAWRGRSKKHLSLHCAPDTGPGVRVCVLGPSGVRLHDS